MNLFFRKWKFLKCSSRGGEALQANWALVWAVPGMGPGMALNAFGVSVRVRPKDAITAAKPAAEDLAVNLMRSLQMLVQISSPRAKTSPQD